MINATDLFELQNFEHRTLFSEVEPVWTGLRDLKSYMDSFSGYHEELASHCDGTPLPHSLVLYDGQIIDGRDCSISFGDTMKGKLLVHHNSKQLHNASVLMPGAILQGSQLAIGNGTLIEGGATIKSPAIIGNCTEIRQGAYMRGYCLIGDRCVVGHATEVKHSIFLDDAKAGHFAYLGDSILGNDANLGAGTKFANLKFTPGNVKIIIDNKLCDTGRRKFGAILGDRSQTGCNSVTNPGTIFGKKTILMPNTTSPPGFHSDKKRIK